MAHVGIRVEGSEFRVQGSQLAGLEEHLSPYCEPRM